MCPALQPRLRFPTRVSWFPVAPALTKTKASSLGFSRFFSRGFCTRCLGFTNFVAKAYAGLASGDLLILSGRRLWVFFSRCSQGHFERFLLFPPFTGFRKARPGTKFSYSSGLGSATHSLNAAALPNPAGVLTALRKFIPRRAARDQAEPGRQ
jgi:hypothetical protein